MSRRIASCLCVAILCISWTVSAQTPPAAPPPSPGFKAGIASATITPQGSVYLAGFAARKERSTGVQADLAASALILDNGQTRVGIMAIDIIGVGPVQLEDIRLAAEKLGIPRAQMMVNSSHTHSGPTFERNGNFPQMFKEKTAAILATAAASLQDAALDYAVGASTMAINRRRLKPDGKVDAMAPEPRKPIDMDVPVLRVTGGDGQVKAIVFGYACHPSALNTTLISPDYVGFARSWLAQVFPGCTSMFLQGCGGDIKPRSILGNGRFGYKSPDVVAELGHELGRAATAALCAPPAPLSLHLAGASATVNLPSKKKSKEQVQVEVQVLRIGEVFIIGINGEVCVEIGLRIKRELSDLRAWVNGYTNLRVGYLPPASAYPEEGYEVKMSAVTEKAEDILVKKAVELARALAQK